MGTVIKLPDSMQRQWRMFEEGLSRLMTSSAASPDEIEYVCGSIKPIWIKAFAKSPTFSGETSMDDLSDWVHDQIGMVVMELVAREVELYRLRGVRNS